MLAVALHEAGAAPEAEAQLRAVLAAQPEAGPARVALAETLLSQGRLAEAAREADAVAAGSPWAPAAARTALFARLADGAPEAEVTAALQRARAAGLDGAELEAFAAWVAVRGGAPVPGRGRIPAPAAPVVLTMLEALLRLEAFDPFAALLAVAEALALPPRERRERLAALYLRRGFLESAADEWVAAVQEHGADVRALRGLSAVAAARGMDEDAVLLAREADALAA
jgi:tetratricopeptide (TPR) repeat protein